MKKQRTLKSILEEFDENMSYPVNRMNQISYGLGDQFEKDMKVVRRFLIESIKDALEACRVEKKQWVNSDKVGGFNDCITQYDENVKKFLGDED